MLFFSFDSLYIILITMLLVRFSLSKSNLTVLVTVCLTGFLSFVLFESLWSIFPVACYFLKDYLLGFFGWLKTSFFSLKSSFFFDNKEEGKEDVLSMKGKEEAVSIPDQTPSPVDADPQSTTSKENPDQDFKVRLVGPNEKVYAEAGTDQEVLISTGVTLIDYASANALALVVFRSYVAQSMQLYNTYGHTAEGIRFADRRVAAMGVFVLVFYCITKSSGDQLGVSIRRLIKNLFDGASRVEDLDQLQVLQAQLAEVVGSNLLLASSVSGEFFEVSQGKVAEFLVSWFKELNELLEKGQIDIDLNGNLSQEDKIRLVTEYKALPEQGKLFLKEYCNKLYNKIVEIDELVGELARVELVNSDTGQSSFSREQNALPTTSPLQESVIPTVRVVELGSLPHPNYPNLTVREYFEEEEDISPKNSHEEFSTGVSPEMCRKEEIARAEARLEGATSLKDNYPNRGRLRTLETAVDQGGPSAVLESSPGRSPGSKHERLFTSPDQDSDIVLIPPTTSESQLTCKDKGKSLSSGNDELPWSSSPLEPLEKDQYFRWLDFGLGVGVLITTSQIALTILRKLDYTQQLVKRVIQLGCPKWVISWLNHSNPGSLAEKPLFHLMIGFLLGNLIILYVLMKIMRLIS